MLATMKGQSPAKQTELFNAFSLLAAQVQFGFILVSSAKREVAADDNDIFLC